MQNWNLSFIFTYFLLNNLHILIHHCYNLMVTFFFDWIIMFSCVRLLYFTQGQTLIKGLCQVIGSKGSDFWGKSFMNWSSLTLDKVCIRKNIIMHSKSMRVGMKLWFTRLTVIQYVSYRTGSSVSSLSYWSLRVLARKKITPDATRRNPATDAMAMPTTSGSETYSSQCSPLYHQFSPTRHLQCRQTYKQTATYVEINEYAIL